MEDNPDLLARAGELLAARPVRRLGVQRTADGLALHTRLVDRADVYLDGRPSVSADVTGETTTLRVPGVASAHVVRVEGFAGGDLVAARTIVHP